MVLCAGATNSHLLVGGRVRREGEKWGRDQRDSKGEGCSGGITQADHGPTCKSGMWQS